MQAWLNTAPNVDDDKGRGAKREKQPTRLARMRSDHEDPEYLPPLPDVQSDWLLTLFWEIGPAESTGMGAAPLSWQEIHAWQDLQGVELPPWQANLLRRVSSAYVAETMRAKSPMALAPWTPGEDDEAARGAHRAAVAEALRRSIRAMAAG